ncbi:MAG: hypothetical protein ACRCUT_14905, partial [Spirochaetota bacterium]
RSDPIKENGTVRVNRGVVKLLLQNKTDLNEYRLYTLARSTWERRSGIFSLDEFCDLLFFTYGYKSLHHGAGNDRYRFKKKLAKMFKSSILFAPLPDGRYRTISERAVLFAARSKRSGWYELPEDLTILKSRQKFTDFCMGTLVAGNRFRANKNIAQLCGCTGRRVQYATSRNHKGSTFHKQYNYVEVSTGTYEEVMRERAILLSEHGITTPLPVRVTKREWVLRLNAPNSYRAIVLSGVKGHKAQPTAKTVRTMEKWFLPVRPEGQKRKHHIQHPDRWRFNDRTYHLGSYILDHSHQFGGNHLTQKLTCA